MVLLGREQEASLRKRYRVTLTGEERADLDRLISRGRAAARTLAHARLLLLLTDGSEGGSGWAEERAAEAVRVRARSMAQGRSLLPSSCPR